MKALVLGGGSIKGAWQVGAIQAVMDTGFKPDMIYGISVGALNSCYLVNEAGKSLQQNSKLDWKEVNKHLIEFWLRTIISPASIAELRSRFTLGIDTVLSRFNGFLDTSPLRRNVIDNELDINIIRRTPIALKIGAVDINTGKMHYIDPLEEHFFDYLQASTSLPFMMPPIKIGGDHKKVFVDGGVCEVVPLKKAIEDGATEIYCIACHPKETTLKPINYHSMFSLMERLTDISVQQFSNADISWAENYAQDILNIGSFSLKKHLNLHVIRPQKSLELELTNFNAEDIRSLIKQGYEEAYLQLNEA